MRQALCIQMEAFILPLLGLQPTKCSSDRNPNVPGRRRRRRLPYLAVSFGRRRECSSKQAAAGLPRLTGRRLAKEKLRLGRGGGCATGTEGGREVGRGAQRTISQHLQVGKKGLVQPLGFLTFLLKSQERRVPRPSFSATLEV